MIGSKDDNDNILIKQLIGKSHLQGTFNTIELKLSLCKTEHREFDFFPVKVWIVLQIESLYQIEIQK